MVRGRPMSFSDPTIAILLRDAQPLHCEVVSEPDEQIRLSNVRRAQVATDTLLRLFREAAACCRLSELYPGVREFVEIKMSQNNGSFPTAKGGRPRADHEQFAIAVAIAMELENGHAGRRLPVIETILKIAQRSDSSFEKARAAYYYWTGHHQLRRPRRVLSDVETLEVKRRHHLVHVEISRRRLEERRAILRRYFAETFSAAEFRSLWFKARGVTPDFAALAKLAPRSLSKPPRSALPKRKRCNLK